MKIYLVRHGQSEGNVRNLWYGRSDLPLTDLGRQQAALVGEKLREIPLAAAYISPLSRASETAEIALAGRGEVRRVILPELREQDMGRLETLSVEEIRQKDPDFFAHLMENWVRIVPPGGEPFDTGLIPRVSRALDEIVSHGEDCAVFAHNGPLCFAMAYLLGLPAEATLRFYLLQGCYSVIRLEEVRAGRGMLERFNL